MKGNRGMRRRRNREGNISIKIKMWGLTVSFRKSRKEEEESQMDRSSRRRKNSCGKYSLGHTCYGPHH